MRFLDPRERRRHTLLAEHARLQEGHLAAVRSGRPSTVTAELHAVERALTSRHCASCGELAPPSVKASEVEFEAAQESCAKCGSSELHADVVAEANCFRCGVVLDLAKDRHSRMTVHCIVDENPSEPAETRTLYEYFAPPTAAKLAYGGAGLVALLAPPETGELAFCPACRAHTEEYLKAQVVESAVS